MNGRGEIGRRESQRPAWALVALLVLLSLVAMVSGYSYYRSYETHYREQVEKQLSAIAKLKVDELVQWRKERLGDAEVFFRNSNFSALVRRLLEDRAGIEARRELEAWLKPVRDAYGYDRVFLLAADGVERLAVPETTEPLAEHLRNRLPEITRSGRIEFLDFHRDATDRPIHLSLVVPVLDERAGHAPLGVLVLRIDPETYLYPLINRWPVPSRTAETLLVRRDGHDSLFLNELKFQKHTALNLRIPLTRLDVPAVKAVLGHEGVEEGTDYRGEAVLAAVRSVPDSPWALVARMDSTEVFSPLRGRLHEIVALIVALVLAGGAAVGLVWRHQRARHYRERYETTAALHAVAARRQALLSAIPDIVMEVDEHKVYTWANQPGFEFFGEGVLGKEVAHYFEGEQDTYHTVQPLFAGREDVVYLESWQRRRDGETRLLAWWCRVLKDADGRVTGALSTARDITESRRAEEAFAVQARIATVFLTHSDDEMFNEVLQVVLEVMKSPFGVFGYLDEAGNLVVPTMTRQVWDKCQVPEKSIVFPRETWGDSSWPRAIRERRPNFSNVVSTKTPAGHVTLHRHISLPILMRGDVIGLFQVANKEADYTEADLTTLETIARFVAPLLGARLHRERAEDALRQRDQELQARNDELVRFTYAVSHDLKSPLVTIKTFLGYLVQDLAGSDPAPVEKDMHYLHAATEKMSRLLDELLELSRVGRTMNPSVEAPLQAIVNEAVDLVAGQIAERGVQLQVTDEPILLFGDRPRLVEVFQNLVDNAVKFMGDQPAPRVEIGFEESGGETVFFVRDTGKGIDPRHRTKLFGLFEKLDPGSDGTGIGLALVKRIVELHGGRIWAESEGIGRGATFRFTLAGTKRQGR
ncbi:MAG: GAF domain-containing protein [Acidobacteria bacterium]|nr:GAF domain-containing protein [Acidobacteriota bacterium]